MVSPQMSSVLRLRTRSPPGTARGRCVPGVRAVRCPSVLPLLLVGAPLDGAEHRPGGRGLALLFFVLVLFRLLGLATALVLARHRYLRSFILRWCLRERHRLQEPWAYRPTGRTSSPCSSPDQIATINPEAALSSGPAVRGCIVAGLASTPNLSPARSPTRRLNYFQSFPPCRESIPGIPVLYPLLATDSSTTTAPHQLLSCICWLTVEQGQSIAHAGRTQRCAPDAAFQTRT